MIGRNEIVLVLLLAMYLVFAYQLSHLLHQKRYGAFALRLLLAPVILLFDWPIRRSTFRNDK